MRNLIWLEKVWRVLFASKILTDMATTAWDAWGRETTNADVFSQCRPPSCRTRWRETPPRTRELAARCSANPACRRFDYQSSRSSHPGVASRSLLSTALSLPLSSTTPSAAADRCADLKRKHADMRARCERQNLVFEPLVLESSGGYHGDTCKLLESLCQIVDAKEHLPHRSLLAGTASPFVY